MTNAEKFLEVFGFIPDNAVCPFPLNRCNDDCKYSKDSLCIMSFWDDKYKENNNENIN